MVLSGSLPLYAQYFEEHDKDAPEGGWTWKDSFHFKEEELQWFYDRGCKWHKVEASPGDLILWDSRCIHYGAAARGDRPRVATCEPSSRFAPGTSADRNRRVLQTGEGHRARDARDPEDGHEGVHLHCKSALLAYTRRRR